MIDSHSPEELLCIANAPGSIDADHLCHSESHTKVAYDLMILILPDYGRLEFGGWYPTSKQDLELSERSVLELGKAKVRPGTNQHRRPALLVVNTAI